MQRAGKLERLTYTLRFYWPFLLGGVLLLLVLGGEWWPGGSIRSRSRTTPSPG